jgi:hypothetical protein
MDSAVGGLVAARICAAGVAKAAEHDRLESKNSKPDPNDAAAAHVRVFFCAWSGTWLSMREIGKLSRQPPTSASPAAARLSVVNAKLV